MIRTFQKTMLTVVLATTFATLAFPNNANAKSVVCVESLSPIMN
jgi:hypothetical protein